MKYPVREKAHASEDNLGRENGMIHLGYNKYFSKVNIVSVCGNN